jgi:hypothetical protein
MTACIIGGRTTPWVGKVNFKTWIEIHHLGNNCKPIFLDLVCIIWTPQGEQQHQCFKLITYHS